MRQLRWFIGAVVLAVIIIIDVVYQVPFLFYPDLPYMAFTGRILYILILSAILCLYRVLRGPTGADRAMAIDILGILVVGFCGLLTISTGRSWYIDIGIAWALQSFIATLALSKYLEGRTFDE